MGGKVGQVYSAQQCTSSIHPAHTSSRKADKMGHSESKAFDKRKMGNNVDIPGMSCLSRRDRKLNPHTYTEEKICL